MYALMNHGLCFSTRSQAGEEAAGPRGASWADEFAGGDEDVFRVRVLPAALVPYDVRAHVVMFGCHVSAGCLWLQYVWTLEQGRGWGRGPDLDQVGGPVTGV